MLLSAKNINWKCVFEPHKTRCLHARSDVKAEALLLLFCSDVTVSLFACSSSVGRYSTWCLLVLESEKLS